MSSIEKVAIIGGGWAGLSCSYTLAKSGIPSLILEAAPQAGGRARTINFNNYLLDNGQHSFVGAYQNILEIIADLNLPFEEYFHRTNCNISTLCNYKKFQFKLPPLPYPLNILFGLVNIKGCSLYEKWLLIKFCFKLKQSKFKLGQDISVQKLLEDNGQTKYLIDYFWNPLALAALTTPIHISSAEIFLNVIQKTFNYPRNFSDFLFSKKDLSNILPNPILQSYPDHISIQYNCRATKVLQTNNDSFTIYHDNEAITAKNLVIATTPIAAHSILTNSNLKLPSTLVDNLKKFTYESIATIYYELTNKYTSFNLPMHGLIAGIGQWIFDRDMFENNKIISVVISTDNGNKQLSHPELAKIVFNELIAKFKNLPDYCSYKVIKEKRAAFSCTVDINQSRPKNYSELNNLYLAGDYTDTNLPATLEGAVMSGKNCAKLIAENV